MDELAKQDVAKKSVETKVADAKLASAAPEPPLRYQLERRQGDGQWVEFGGELTAGDSARLRVVASQAGFVSLIARDRNGAAQSLGSQAVEPGQTFYLPASGPLPAGAGERILELALSRSPVSRSPVVAAATGQAELGRSARLRQMAPPAGARKLEKAKEAVQPEAAPFSITIRLQYR